MMDTEIDRGLLEKITDLIGKPVGAFNIRKDSGCDGRQSTEHIEITSKEDKPGIDIRVKPGTVGETCYIPVIITKSGLREMVYNDFFIGEGCDVDIVAGRGPYQPGGGGGPPHRGPTLFPGEGAPGPPTGGRSLPSCFKSPLRTATSAGDTPDTRPAWPRFLGRMASSFCRASSRRPSMDR